MRSVSGLALLLLLLFCLTGKAQVSYSAAAAYSVRKVVPTYTGSALQVQRSCDNGVKSIGFTSCGDLDTTALKAFVLAGNPLSAITASSSTAFSLRRLRCSYTGSAVCVRSSAAGNPTANIGFTANGDLDTASLKTFIGSNSGYVTIWYDQSGNGRNASQSTTGSQPRIVNAGVIERQGNMPAIRWLGMGYSLSTAAFTTYTAAACFNGVARVNTNVTYNTIHNKTTSNLPAPLDLYNAQMVIGNGTGSNYNFFAYGQTFNASLPLSIWTYQAASGGAYNFYYNGGSTGSGTVGYYGDNGNPLVLGSRADGVTGLDGWISESITFNSIPSATDRQFIEWSQGQYYSISGAPSLSLIPAAAASASVSAWYDQSGNGNDAVQTTTANQPRIVNAGVIDKNGLNPCLNFAGYPQNLVAPLSTSAYPVSISVLASTSGSSTGGAFVKLGTNVNGGAAGIAIGSGNSGGNFDTPGTSLICLKEWVSWCPSSPNVNFPSTFFETSMIQQSGGGGTSAYLNGTAVPLSNSTNAVSASITGSLLIGGYTNTANRYATAKQSEVLVFNSALSNTRRTLLETNQATYNGITISNSKYTAPSSSSYQRYVNGVGRESATDSVAGTPSTVGMGISTGSTSSDFLKDNGDYLTYGINCPISATVSTSNLPATIVERWYNDWYLNKTDVNSNNGTITFFFDFGDYGLSILPGTASNYELLARSSAAGTFSIISGTTKSVVGKRVLFAIDAANITTNYYYTIGTRNLVVSPLPIDLLSFDASCQDQAVKVSWSTASQTNNDHFTIERTQDNNNMEAIGTVKGAGTTSERRDYVYMDEKPLSGVSYYRLKETDIGGKEKSFDFVSVDCENIPESLRIYPNPSTGIFTLEGTRTYPELRIVNAIGITVFQKTQVLTKQELDLRHLPDGIYMVIITDSGTQNSLKLVIRH